MNRSHAARTFTLRVGRHVSTAAAIAVTVFLSPAFAQWQGYKTPGIPRKADGTFDASAAVPRAADGKPDLSGIWMAPRIRVDLAQGMKKGETVPFTPEGKRIFDERRATNSKDDPGARCLPTGIPVRATLQTPFKILQTPGVTAILYESRTQFRQILTDGRSLPKEVDWPAWQGFSVGRWDGDTFVVETAGFNGKVWLDQVGTPASDAFRLTERFHRRDFGHMEVEMIIDDRKMYTRPWSTIAELLFQPDTELLEYICEENERDSARMVGK
jgi:hypothetical protein